MKKVELLAPAGSMESLIAAVNNGADAVYLGGSKFSARAYASNFDNEKIKEAVDYAHLYNVQVYITINTLIKQNEIEEAMDFVDFLYKVGVDALIIQDVGLLKRVKDKYKDFEVHASTQMSIHNGEGALFFKDQGFHRIVLSRELSLKEIEFISKDLGVETEIFVHGALCVCYSGQCLMSSMIGGRSGNRGRCAQPCRLPYKIINKETNESKEGYLLSPKDICTIENVEDIINSGAYSLKLEGRMKRPEYVAGIVKSYREAIDKSLEKEKYDSKKSKNMLLKLFNREGFSKAYLYKNEGKDMMAYNNPKNTGVFLGVVSSKGEIQLKEDISLKDGVSTGNDGFIVSKILLNNKEVEWASKGQTVKLFPKNYKGNQKLYKTSDSRLLDELKKDYEDKYLRKIPLKAEFTFKIGEPMKLSVNYNNILFEAEGDVVETALKKPLEKEKVRENLQKSGDNPFKIQEITFTKFDNGFVRISSINALRRNVIDKITSNIVEGYRRTLHSQEKLYENYKKTDLAEILYCLNTKEQLNAVMTTDVKDICIDIFGKNKGLIHKSDMKEIKGKNIYIKVPTIIKEEWNSVVKLIDELIPYIKGICTANVGIINVFKDKTNIIGDYKLNIFNSSCVDFYRKHINLPFISLELNRKELKQVLKLQKGKPVGINIYGKPEVMVSEYCPIGSTFGGRCKDKECNSACVKNRFALRDRKNEDFTVLTDIYCRSHIYNNVPLNLINEKEDLKSIGITNFRVDFTDENYEETLKVIDSIENETKLSGEFTKGHYKRGVE